MGGGLSTPIPVLNKSIEPIAQKLGFEADAVVKLYAKFEELDEDSSGTIDIWEFCDTLQVEVTEFLVRMFDLIDQNGSGELDFHEFLIGLWNVCTFDQESMVRFAFQLYDYNDDGFLKKQELEDLVRAVHGSKVKGVTMHNIMLFFKNLEGPTKGKKDRSWSYDEFKQCSRKFPSLFAPAFVFQMRLKEELYGSSFWKSVAKSRKEKKLAGDLEGFKKLAAATVAHASSQRIEPTAKEFQARLSVSNRTGGTIAGSVRRNRPFQYRGTALKMDPSFGELDQKQLKAQMMPAERFTMDRRARLGLRPPPKPRKDEKDCPYMIVPLGYMDDYIQMAEQESRDARDRSSRVSSMMNARGGRSTRASSLWSERSGSLRSSTISENYTGGMPTRMTAEQRRQLMVGGQGRATSAEHRNKAKLAQIAADHRDREMRQKAQDREDERIRKKLPQRPGTAPAQRRSQSSTEPSQNIPSRPQTVQSVNVDPARTDAFMSATLGLHQPTKAVTPAAAPAPAPAPAAAARAQRPQSSSNMSVSDRKKTPPRPRPGSAASTRDRPAKKGILAHKRGPATVQLPPELMQGF